MHIRLFVLILITNVVISAKAQTAEMIGKAFAETIHHFSVTETDSLRATLMHKYRKDVAVLTAIGGAYFQNQEVAVAKQILEQASKVDPMSDLPYIQFGDIYKYYWTTPGNLDTARVWYQKAQSVKPANPTAYNKEVDVLMMKYRMYGNNENHEDSLKMKVVADSAVHVLTLLSEHRPDILLAPQIGDIYNKVGRFDESSAQYAIAEDSLEAYQMNNYALNHYFTQNYKQALEIAIRGRERFPDYPQFWRTTMYCNAELGNHAASIEEYHKLIAATDSLVSFDFYYAGNAYLQQGDVVEATKVFNRLYETNDEFKYRHINAVPKLIKRKAGGYSADGDYDTAARIYTQYYDNKQNRQAFDLYTIAEVYREEASDELVPLEQRLAASAKADSVYALVLSEYPDYETILITYYRGAVLWNIDAEEKMANGHALPHFKQVLTLIEAEPDVRGAKQMLSTAYRYLAVYSLQHDFKTKAKQYARKYKDLNPDDTSLDAILTLR